MFVKEEELTFVWDGTAMEGIWNPMSRCGSPGPKHQDSALAASPQGKISRRCVGGWAQGWMMSGCRAACPPVWPQREAPGAGRRVGKLMPLRGSGLRHRQGMAAGCRWWWPVLQWLYPLADQWGRCLEMGKSPRRWEVGGPCSEREVKEPGGLATSFGVGGWQMRRREHGGICGAWKRPKYRRL